MNNSLAFLESLETKQDDPAARYSISVNIEIKFTRSKAKDALGVQITNNPNASEIRLTEEQVWEKYPWDYDRLTGECRKRHRGSSWSRNSTTFASSSPPMPGLVMCAISILAIQKVRSSRSLTQTSSRSSTSTIRSRMRNLRSGLEGRAWSQPAFLASLEFSSYGPTLTLPLWFVLRKNPPP